MSDSFLPLATAAIPLGPISEKVPAPPPNQQPVFYFKFRNCDRVYWHPSGLRWDETLFQLETRFHLHGGEEAITSEQLAELIENNRSRLNNDKYGAHVTNNRYLFGRSKFIGYPACVPEPKDDKVLRGLLYKPDYIVPANAKITLRRVMMEGNVMREVPPTVMRRLTLKYVADASDSSDLERFAIACSTNAFIASQLPQEKRYHVKQR